MSRGRKRQRKKDAKRRGIWKLPFAVSPKRGERDQETADALAKYIAYKWERNGPAYMAVAVRELFTGTEARSVENKI